MSALPSRFDLRAFELLPTCDGLRLLDQRLLPATEAWLELRDTEDTARAIETLAVRGAPAIGCVVALELAALAERNATRNASEFVAAFAAGCDRLARTRPTAVNLFWALEHMSSIACDVGDETVPHRVQRLREAAITLVQREVDACKALAAHGAALLPDTCRVLTHCNAGALATAGWGTALGVIRSAVVAGKRVLVYVDETRPLLQGARLTAWELARADIAFVVVTDGMAASLMARGEIDLAIVGADRIARNGDVANKIGTYGVAVWCAHHEIPFYVAAPWSTVDSQMQSGREIPIEQRSDDEVRRHGGQLMTPPDARACNPAFDVTPAELVTAIITEHGVFTPQQLQATCRSSHSAP